MTLRLFAVFALFLLLTVPLAAQDAGSVHGQVFDPAGETLSAAQIRLEGTTFTATTDLDGAYRLALVPAGKYVIQIEYLGYPNVEAEIEVVAGETLHYDANFGYGEVLDVAAAPLLSGQARALNQQKNAVNIMNIVAADQIGRFPDPNAAEAAQRVPAVTLQRDQGEGRYVLVRGTEARLNSMTINGERIPAPEGDRRDIALDVIPADLLEAIEVSKALTPDMDGDAVGGTVNLVTKRAPESRRVSATLGAGCNQIVEDSIGNANFTYGGRTGENKSTGIVISGSALETDRGSDNFEVEYDDGFLDDLQLRDYAVERQRYGLTAALDRRFSDGADFFVRGIWNRFDDQEERRRLRHRPGDDAVEREMKDRLESQEITSFQIGGADLFGRSALLEYRFSWSRSTEEEPDRLDSVFLQEDVEFAPNVSPNSIDPDDIRANPLNEDFRLSELDEIIREDNLTEDEDLVGAIDVSLPFYRDSGATGIWKFGAKARFKEKSRDLNVFELAADDLALLDIADDWVSETPFYGGRYVNGPFPSVAGLRDFAAGLDAERDIEEDLADYRVDEDTLAAYGMLELQLDKLTFVGGLRWESTETTADAFELIDGDDFLSPVSSDNDYDELLPMAHLRWAISDESNLRVAVTRTLSRAHFQDLAPFLFEQDEERERGNPDLNVTTALNFDLLYERYLEGAGVFAAGVFYKDIDDNIFTFTSEEIVDAVVFDVVQPLNGEGGELTGFELAFQNRFASLPDPWDGLGLYFNWTWTDSEADFPFRDSTRLPGQADQIGNLSVSYEKGGFSGRLSMNYHSEYIAEIGEETAEDIYFDEHMQLDFSASQRINDHFRIYLELINLTDEPLRLYEGVPDRPIQEEIYSWWGTIGVKMDF